VAAHGGGAIGQRACIAGGLDDFQGLSGHPIAVSVAIALVRCLPT